MKMEASRPSKLPESASQEGRNSKSDNVAEICVDDVKRQANDSVAFNDHHVDEVRLMIIFQYEANGAYEVTLIRIFIKLLNIDFEWRQTASSIVKCARSKPCNRKGAAARSPGRAELRCRGSA
jgi:hypothetical protein